MRAHSIMPVTIAVAVSVSAWLSGCGPDETSTTTTTASTSSSSGAGGNGSGGNGSGGDGGTAAPLPNEKCPGEPLTLNLGDTMTISASTEPSSDDLSSACAGKGGADVVYAITLAENGTFKAKVTAGAASALNPALYLRSACEDDASLIKCVDLGTAKVEYLALEAAADTYYLVVDGSAAGAFDLTLSLTAPSCGDHVLNPGEACDPPGPGCDATCQLQAASIAQDKCPGTGNVYTVPSTGLTIPDHYTTGFADEYTPMGCATPGSGGPDRVYQLVPDIDGMMTVKVGYDVDGTTSVCDQDPENTGCFDRVLYARTACNDMASELACANAGAYSPESITFPVTALNQYYIFVDGGEKASFGTYTLFVDLQP
jgi:hypothetical protein